MTTKLKGGLDVRAYDRNGNLKWAVVAAIISEKYGQELSAAQIRSIAHRAMKKLRVELERSNAEDSNVASAYFADLTAAYEAYEAWKHRVAPKKDQDFAGWEE